MRRAYLDYTGELAREIDLGLMLPRSWRVVGSTTSPYPGVVRLIMENDEIDDGPIMTVVIKVTETAWLKTFEIDVKEWT